MADFEKAIKYVLENEGGWTIDSGGWTMYGITVPAVARHRHVASASITEHYMRNLRLEEAKEIYREQYWLELSCDKITDQAIATCILDTGVNRGPSVAAKYAQRVANMLKPNQLSVDGMIGPKSLAVINACQPLTFVRNFEAMEMAGYNAIIARDPGKYERYRKGWTRRAERLLTLIKAEVSA